MSGNIYIIGVISVWLSVVAVDIYVQYTLSKEKEKRYEEIADLLILINSYEDLILIEDEEDKLELHIKITEEFIRIYNKYNTD